MIELPNPGYAAAVNRARLALESAIEYLLVLTQEVVLLPDTITSMLKTINDQSAACVGPTLYRVSAREKVFSYGGSLALGGNTRHLKRAKQSSPYCVDWIDGAVMLLRLRAFDHVGGLDERFFLYYEEVDLAYRMRSFGYSVLVDPRATAYQEPGAYPPYLRFRNHLLFARSRYSIFEVSCALLIKLIRSVPGWVWRGQFTALFWSARGTIDGLRQRGGTQPEKIFSPAGLVGELSK